MDYQNAVEALNQGKSVYRAGWADKTSLVTGDSIANANGTDKYIPTENDLLADDWKVAAPEGRREEPVEEAETQPDQAA